MAWRLVPDVFFFIKKALKEVKASDLKLSFKIFRQPSTYHAIKTNCLKLQTTNPEICPVLTFQKRIWEQFLLHILCVIFQEKYFLSYILLIDQILLSDCLYFLRYWTICVWTCSKKKVPFWQKHDIGVFTYIWIAQSLT